jgi:hypothetical protein
VTGINDFEARLATGVLFTSQQAGDSLDPLRVRPGIRDAPGNPGRITLGTNKVTVNAFQAVIQDSARPALGAYVVTLDAPKDLPLNAADPSLGRIDLVIAEVDATVDPGFTVHVVQGDTSASPQVPNVTNPLHIKLAQITIPAGTGTPSFTDLRQFTAAVGGILPVRTVTERPAGAPGSLFVYRLDTGVLEVQRASGWAPYRPPRGSVDTWHPATLLNGWANFAAGYALASYTITEDGWVRLQGLVRSGDITKPIFTLPAGWRPLASHIFAAKIFGASPGTGRLDVQPNGNVVNASTVDGNISAAWTSLAGITFPTY